MKMIYDDAGGVVKYCKRCGKKMVINDYFAALSRKYCTECSKENSRMLDAGYKKKIREQARERRKMEREKMRLLEDENAMLRQELEIIRQRVKAHEKQRQGI